MRIPPRTAVALATATLLATGLTALGGPAGAAPAQPDPGALPAKLSPGERTALIKSADAGKAATAKALKLGASEQLVVRDVLKDRDGTVHTRYERTYAGLPVLGGDLVVHTGKDGRALGVTKKLRGSPAVDTKASVTPGGDSRKVVWAGADKPVLAWETVTRGTQADGTPSELHTITDARNGKELYSYEAVRSEGTGNSMYAGTVALGTTAVDGGFVLTDAGRGGHTTYDLNHATKGQGTAFTDADDTWGDGTGTNPQTAAVDAHYGAAATWDYYLNTHGRNGIADDGQAAYSRVHYGDNYVNAFWQDSCFCMTYGDGIENTHPLTALDVAGHEMSHGVTAATAGLIYSKESGGLNEATSDIFGTAVEFSADNSEDTGDYLIGEEVDLFGDGTPLRFMDEPSKDGVSADYWSVKLGKLNVHYSSGVANHFFYLLSEGSGQKTINGVTYDSPTFDGQPVSGIGRAAAEQIWYRALTVYMTKRTDYADARIATLQAAADLFGDGSAQQQAVDRGWAAVNVH
ncbi:Transglutaminase-activating metalloprotease [Streptomyces sp. RB5]|uniref:Neutral metalloproteinase n=1 Tax=Streptomyces smaragdinus TaxID=2585196 RepID=A0A7K0CF42_9ACTN|nr:M4 family metallopeptidase [Streptomyces smaragdinus]MQY12087.1 Transglutaminase-activating metalloprotease [Streptomyces smaragdinus]